MTFDAELTGLANDLIELLKTRQQRIVFAESCTAGLLSCTLSQMSGVSDSLCGSAVTYRNETKANWLNVSRDDLANAEIGPVSAQVAKQMCVGVLTNTPEADVAVSITGHLGPQAPPEQDGLIYVGLVIRGLAARALKHQLTSQHPDSLQLRHHRQIEAAKFALTTMVTELQSSPIS